MDDRNVIPMVTSRRFNAAHLSACARADRRERLGLRLLIGIVSWLAAWGTW
jgi:hypothetical protein